MKEQRLSLIYKEKQVNRRLEPLYSNLLCIALIIGCNLSNSCLFTITQFVVDLIYCYFLYSDVIKIAFHVEYMAALSVLVMKKFEVNFLHWS